MQVQIRAEEVVILPDGRMNTKNAAIYAGLSEKTMAMMRCAGKGPEYIKMGKIFYFQGKLDDWVEGSTVKISS